MTSVPDVCRWVCALASLGVQSDHVAKTVLTLVSASQPGDQSMDVLWCALNAARMLPDADTALPASGQHPIACPALRQACVKLLQHFDAAQQGLRPADAAMCLANLLWSHPAIAGYFSVGSCSSRIADYLAAAGTTTHDVYALLTLSESLSDLHTSCSSSSTGSQAWMPALRALHSKLAAAAARKDLNEEQVSELEAVVSDLEALIKPKE